MILISILFLIPIHYTARSKGYNGGLLATVTGLLAATALLASVVIPGQLLRILQLALPATVLGVVWFLPPRPNAPGKAYLRIKFTCPECGKTVSFPRHREGVAELCPECGEVIRVPEDEHSPSPGARDRTRPSGTQGPVCFDSFGRPEPAHQLAAILSDNGVEARVVSDSAGGVLPQVGNTQGHRVMIDVAQWDEAVEIEKECQQEGPPNFG